MKNKLTPQDYCEMIVKFVNMQSANNFSEADIHNYCVSNSEVLDIKDNIIIKQIISNVLTTLTNRGFLSKQEGKGFTLVKQITQADSITIFECEPKMKSLTQKQANKLINLEVSLSNDPSSTFGMSEDEKCQ